MADLFDDLPAPETGKLTCYFLGPGFGESQVIFLPDGKVVVVDCCKKDGEVLPLALLQHLGRTDVSLLVVTHGDLDHVDGLPELIAGTQISEVWRFPEGSWFGEIAAEWCRLDPDDARLLRLHQALQALEALEDTDTPVWSAQHGLRSWPDEGAGYRLTCFAPTRFDCRRMRRWLKTLVEAGAEGPQLGERFRRYLAGERPYPGGSANPLSLAISVEWEQVRVLLCGDVENGTADPRSGWSGVLLQLDERNEGDLIRNVQLVKAAHHGSSGAYSPEAWERHAESEKVGLCVVSPFNRGGNPPPHPAFTRGLRRHAKISALTAAGRDAPAVLRQGGWARLNEPSRAGTAAWLAVELQATTETNLTWGAPVTLWKPKPRRPRPKRRKPRLRRST